MKIMATATTIVLLLLLARVTFLAYADISLDWCYKGNVYNKNPVQEPYDIS